MLNLHLTTITIAGVQYIRLDALTQALGYGRGARAACKVMKYATVTALTVHEGEVHATLTISGATAHAGEGLRIPSF